MQHCGSPVDAHLWAEGWMEELTTSLLLAESKSFHIASPDPCSPWPKKWVQQQRSILAPQRNRERWSGTFLETRRGTYCVHLTAGTVCTVPQTRKHMRHLLYHSRLSRAFSGDGIFGPPCWGWRCTPTLFTLYSPFTRVRSTTPQQD